MKRAISLKPLVKEPDREEIAALVAAEVERQMSEREAESWKAFVARLPKLARERLEGMSTDPDRQASIAKTEALRAFGQFPTAPLSPKDFDKKLDDLFLNGGTSPKGFVSSIEKIDKLVGTPVKVEVSGTFDDDNPFMFSAEHLATVTEQVAKDCDCSAQVEQDVLHALAAQQGKVAELGSLINRLIVEP